MYLKTAQQHATDVFNWCDGYRKKIVNHLGPKAI